MYGTNLIFQQTCSACPEQYDVLSPDGEIIGYVRYRHGCLSADYYPPEKCNCYGDSSESIFHQGVGNDGWRGILTAEERDYYLPLIANEIASRYWSYKCNILHDEIFGSKS